ncbi:hypothetical protein KEM55_003087 [Ascosphaera atra]|nr:hypothetical protein KEM55_003087 [Ascosphaera atra]
MHPPSCHFSRIDWDRGGIHSASLIDGRRSLFDDEDAYLSPCTPAVFHLRSPRPTPMGGVEQAMRQGSPSLDTLAEYEMGDYERGSAFGQQGQGQGQGQGQTPVGALAAEMGDMSVEDGDGDGDRMEL